MTELKRCPFCGGEAEIYPEVDGMMGKFWYIRCKKCYSRGTGIYESGRKLEPQEEYAAITGAWEKATEAWNRRAKDEPKRRHGKWIKDTGCHSCEREWMPYKCSECGKSLLNRLDQPNYCPNCGADMREV